MTEIRSPLQAQIVQWQVAPGDTVRAGDLLVVLEAMKMEHEVRAQADGRIRELLFSAGETVNEGEVLLLHEPLADSQSELLADGAGGPAPMGTSAPDLVSALDASTSMRSDPPRPAIDAW